MRGHGYIVEYLIYDVPITTPVLRLSKLPNPETPNSRKYTTGSPKIKNTLTLKLEPPPSGPSGTSKLALGWNRKNYTYFAPP